jgi:hypothetical protein
MVLVCDTSPPSSLQDPVAGGYLPSWESCLSQGSSGLSHVGKRTVASVLTLVLSPMAASG